MVIVGGVFGFVSWKLTDPSREKIKPQKGCWIGSEWIKDN